MVRSLMPPLNPDDQAIHASLPKHAGAVVNPKYLQGAARERVERDLLAWCESHSGRDWPQWVAEWHLQYQTARRRGAGAAHGG